jgi:prepilin-type N-terminal cleavage/methylation domain-containing protein
MKLQIPTSSSSRNGSPARNHGFTLPEILVAMTIFGLVVAGIVTANLFGLRMFQVNENKLSATEWSRNTFGKITDEIHTSTGVSVGNMTVTTNADMTENDDFTGLLPGEIQQGTAIQITNSTGLVYYFVNTSDETFRRTEMVSSGTNTVILADSVTNTVIFSAQDFSGTVLSNNVNNQVIHLTLEFYQPERFTVGPDHYRLETSVTRRAVQ